uniref:Ileal sodium/bile acid cotransporter-like n=1 Tax=Saccoglossus kowalevskii TaxID=10224 RepID=A0ABM0GW78_SACKO|nr:PREDICTED: ileal sodium/bile acid cotransporter-like [Saccoglossus kowalevskii]
MTVLVQNATKATTDTTLNWIHSVENTTTGIDAESTGYGQSSDDYSTLVTVMIGMGCTLTWEEIWKNLKKPVGICVGVLCQFCLMPLLGFGLAHAFGLPGPAAIGTLIIACCPGGVASNVFTLWGKGDTCLSVCMTTVSTILAIGMMPLWLWVYSRSWSSNSTVIPYTDIVISLVVILIPAGVGMLINWKWPKIANKITSIKMSVRLMLSQSYGHFGTHNGCTNEPFRVCLLGVFNLPESTLWRYAVVYLCWGYSQPSSSSQSYRQVYFYRHGDHTVWHSYTRLLRLRSVSQLPGCAGLSYPKCRTVAFETGIQNTALALTIINLSFSRGFDAFDTMVVPSLHGVATISEALIFTAVLRVVMHVTGKKKRRDTEDAVIEKEHKSLNLGSINPGFDKEDIDTQYRHVEVQTENVFKQDERSHYCCT